MDELKRMIMESRGIASDEEYWECMESYAYNIVCAPEEVCESIMRYIETHDPMELTVAAENRMAEDAFGGYRYAEQAQ